MYCSVEFWHACVRVSQTKSFQTRHLTRERQTTRARRPAARSGLLTARVYLSSAPGTAGGACTATLLYENAMRIEIMHTHDRMPARCGWLAPLAVALGGSRVGGSS